MNEALQPSTVVRACLRQMSAQIEGRTIVLNFEDGMYYSLDPVGARIWELVQSPQSVADILDAILGEFDVDAARCEGDLIEILTKLKELSLVEIVDAEPT